MVNTKRLPSDYTEVDRWSLKQGSGRDILLVNVFGLVLMLISLFAVTFVLAVTTDSDGITLEGHALIIGLVIGLVIGVVLHELVHGVFFFAFGARPRFGFKPWTRFGPVFYAAAPGSYLRRAEYVAVCLAPMVLLTVLPTIVLVFVPASGLLFSVVLWVLLLNGAGSAGDLLITRKVISYPDMTYFEDNDDGFVVFGPASSLGAP